MAPLFVQLENDSKKIPIQTGTFEYVGELLKDIQQGLGITDVALREISLYMYGEEIVTDRTVKDLLSHVVEPTDAVIVKIDRSAAVSVASPDRVSHKRIKLQSVLSQNIEGHKKLPIGMDSFRTIVEENFTFVDKSMLIAEFVDSSSQVSLILRPRRFGKSLNLSMLRYFFEKYDERRPLSAGRKTRRELFKGLKVESERPDLFESSFAKYPVIYLSLKDVKASSWSQMLSMVRILVASVYRGHRYVGDSLFPDEKIEFERIVNKDPTFTGLWSSFKDLSGYLHRHHQAKCVVLIDEYDAPIDSAYNSGYYEEAKEFFGAMFSSMLKSNDDIHKALLVGVLRVAKSGFLSGLNNLSVFPMHLKEYSDKFGFTEFEVDLLLRQYEIAQLADHVRLWYNGYLTNHDIPVYNPWSLVNVCAGKELRPYWCESGGTSTLRKLIWNTGNVFQDAFTKLLDGHSVSISLQDDVGYDNLSQNASVNLWSLLYYSGYLTINSRGCLFIPNHEVKLQWQGWFLQCLNNGTPTVESLLDILLAGNVTQFSEIFPTIVLESLSYFDVGGNNSTDKAENFYHAFSLGLFVAARAKGFEIKSNREAGLGRYDVTIIPEKGQGIQGVVIEFKVTGKSETLEVAAARGLEQIEDQKYRSGMPGHVKKVVEIGIAFEGKRAMVKGRVLAKHDGNWIVQ